MAGVTFVELVLALGITGLVGLGVAAMMVSSTYGLTSQKGMRNLVVRHKTIGARLDSAMRGAKQVLASGDGYLVLWIEDTRADGKPNISELRRIELDGSTDELSGYVGTFPSGWSEAAVTAADTAYELTDNFDTVTTALKSGSYFPKEVWGEGVTAWTMSFDDNGDPTTTYLISYRMTLDAGGTTSTAIGAAALRNRG